MNTPEGGKTLRAAMIKRYGSEEAWRAVMRERGARGGKLGKTGGFYANRDLARTAGAAGGHISRRTWTQEERDHHGDMVRKRT